MLTAGISAGFFVFERMRLAGGALILITTGVSVCLFSSEHRGKPPVTAYRLIAVMAAGFLVFTCSFIRYGMITPEGYESGEEGEGRLTGEVLSAQTTDSGLRLVISPSEGRSKVIVNIYDEDHPEPRELIGRTVTAYGKFSEPAGADNPGCFDYRTYLRSRGIGLAFSAGVIEITDEPLSLRGRRNRSLFLIREGFLDLFTDETIRAFIQGTVFGDKSRIDEDIIDDFNQNGTGHILAVSGLHTGFLYSLLRLLAGRRKTIGLSVLIILILLIYGSMTMWSPSAVRSVTVLSISLMAVYLKRPFDLLSSVSAAAFLMLITEPYRLFSSGFQMSFAALLGIAFLTRPLSAFIGEPMAVMIAVQAGAAPLTAFIFHRLNILSVFINIPVIFAASVLVPLCMLELSAEALTGCGIAPLTSVIEGLSEILIRMNQTAAESGFSVNVTAVNAGMLILIYLTLMLISSEWTRVRILRKEHTQVAMAFVCIALVSASFAAASFNTFADDEVVFVSVGQGDCTHIRASEHGCIPLYAGFFPAPGTRNILIDGGGSTERNVGKDILMPYLLSNSTDKTELAIATHLHTDHLLGLLQLDREFPVGTISIPEDYRRSIEKERDSGNSEQIDIISDEEQNYGSNTDTIESLLYQCDDLSFTAPGTCIDVTDSVFIEPIWPLRGHRPDAEVDDPNENNMVFIVNYNGIRIMVTGDLLEEDEHEILKHYRPEQLRCDILKVAHHGSKSSSSEEFLDAVSPTIAVIQVGRHNFYGHPHEQTLRRLEKRGIKVYRTDLNGAVGIDIKRNGLKADIMRPEKNARMSGITDFYS